MTSFSCAPTGRTAFRRLPLLVGALLLLPACAGLGDAMSAHTDIVAKAAGKELRVEDAAAILASNAQIPPDPQVVRALADLWIDYSLLATAVAEDPTLATLDMAAFVAPAREQRLVMRVGEMMVRPDTLFDDAEVQRRWAIEGPGAEISARHILLRTPADATDVQRDSVRGEAEALRARALAGEPFDALARDHSQDPGSAVRGGDLGFFSRGRMVEPFEEAAFQLEPGETSEVIETPFGYHVIRVDERRQQELGEDREEFRRYLISRALEDAERVFLDSIADAVNVRVPPTAVGVVREVANRPDRNLSGRQGERLIAEYDGGGYTVAEFATFIREQPAQVQSAFATAPNEQVEAGIHQLVQMELLLAYAEREGIALTPAEDEEILFESRSMIEQLIEATGFAEAARQGADASFMEGYVMDLVQGIVSGQQPFIPLGRLGVGLRDLYAYDINDGAVSQVVSRLEAIRASQPAQPILQGIPGEPLPEEMLEQAQPVDPAAQQPSAP